MMLGIVKNYDPKKGYGFIRGEDDNEYFVPRCNIKTESGILEKGYGVKFCDGKNDQGYIASDVKLM